MSTLKRCQFSKWLINTNIAHSEMIKFNYIVNQIKIIVIMYNMSCFWAYSSILILNIEILKFWYISICQVYNAHNYIILEKYDVHYITLNPKNSVVFIDQYTVAACIVMRLKFRSGHFIWHTSKDETTAKIKSR